MTPYTDQPASAFAGDRHAMSAGAEPDVIGALLQALNGSGEYRIVDLGGELFLEPCGQRIPLALGREVEM
jgi:hypothetical protein